MNSVSLYELRKSQTISLKDQIMTPDNPKYHSSSVPCLPTHPKQRERVYRAIVGSTLLLCLLAGAVWSYKGPEFGKAGKMGEAADDVPHDFHPEIERQAGILADESHPQPLKGTKLSDERLIDGNSVQYFLENIERKSKNLQKGDLRLNPNARCPDSAFPKKGPNGEPPTIFLTTSTTKFMRMKKRFNFSHSFWDSKSSYPVWYFHENTWDNYNNRKPLRESEVPNTSCFLDVFDSTEGLLSLLTTKDSVIDELYKIPYILSLADTIMDGKALIRKVAAMAHAAHQLPDGAMMIWVDVDTKIIKPFDKKFYDFAYGRDVSYMAEVICARSKEMKTARSVGDIPQWCRDYKIETGVFAIKVGPETRNFLKKGLMWYNGPMLQLARDCFLGNPTIRPPECEIGWIRHNIGLNDVFVLNLLMHAAYPRKQGFFSYSKTLCNIEELRERVLGHCPPCHHFNDPQVEEKAHLVSSFLIEEYVEHYHDHTGIMAALHSDVEFKDVKKSDKTKDRSMKPPPEFLRLIHTHLDPRPACDDSRSRKDCFHTIKCGGDETLSTPTGDTPIPVDLY
ncbi:hypothetical protein AAMO2058_001420800 [Amorphochlora amoebiformis]